MRSIALLEFSPGLIADITPPSSYMQTTNGTLIPESCRLIIDENGFMVSETPYQQGHKKILLLGGSSIENLYIPQNQRVMSRIEDYFSSTGKPVKIYNAAISNAHLLHNINILLNKGIGLRPDFVIYYPTSSLDVLANEIDNGFWNTTMTPVRKSGNAVTVEWPKSYCNKNKFADEKRMLCTLFDICRNFNIQLFISTWPPYGAYDTYIQKSQPDQVFFEAEDAQTSLLNLAVREVCLEKGSVLVDLALAFSSIDRTKYFYDWNHLNIAGCEMVASLTSQALQPYI